MVLDARQKTSRLILLPATRYSTNVPPGDLNKEILEHRNVAAAIIAAAVILGVSIIIAASMLG
jgi:uncharacterized membrane protein YjfL (UPF0719 family)